MKLAASPPPPDPAAPGGPDRPRAPVSSGGPAAALGGQSVRRLCPAKVNLYLKVLRRRPDGYHDLVSVMQPLALADELVVAAAGETIKLECNRPELAGEENLAWRAARLFLKEAGLKMGLKITLRKRIPVAAGLGGGSSDAAAALLALNRLAPKPLDPARLHRLAAGLGADVPFFLLEGPAVARGIGTELTPLNLPRYWYLLLNPGLPLSTRWVYENLDPELVAKVPATEAWDPEHPESWVHNDLGTVALGRFPQLTDLLRQLQDLEARAQAVSGSGPTVFGLFDTEAAARGAATALRGSFSGWMAIARGLTGLDTDNHWEGDAWTI